MVTNHWIQCKDCGAMIHVEVHTEIQANSDRSIETLDLSVHPYSCLLSADIRSIGKLIERTREDLLRIPRLGKAALREVENALDILGLKLKDDSRLAPETASQTAGASRPNRNASS